MTDATEMPKYDGMEYEELVATAQFLWMENAKLRELIAEMFKEHQCIYHTGGVLKMGPSATNKQMARWYGECMRWGIEVEP